MNLKLAFLTCFLWIPINQAVSQEVQSNIPYDTEHKRQVLDVYSLKDAAKKPVVFWIHGGGWQVGDKTDVQLKPKWFVENGFVFVSTNYRLLPDVDMETLIGDVAKSLGWVHKNISKHGGDPNRIFVMGHSAGAQLAALLCVDGRYLKAEEVPMSALKGCVPVDGDTFDIPKIILTAEFRQVVYGKSLPTFGHRQKFGNDPKKHVDFSAVTHVARDKGIPPFLILHISGHPDTTAQARRLGEVLKQSEIPVQVFAAPNTNHRRLNKELGKPNDPATVQLKKFLMPLIGK